MSKGKDILATTAWDGDLLGREEEAELLAAYIQCVASRKESREDAHAFTIAIDADYGVGKTFFLRRFAKHLAATHPVALVDAWADDLADEPLTALAATLKDALAPLIKKPKGLKAWQRVTHASGEVAKVVAMGLAQRALTAMFTTAGAELLTQTMRDLSKETTTGISTEMRELAGDAAEGAVEGFMEAPPSELMDQRIDQFRAGKAAVEEMKSALRALVSQLPFNGLQSPIVIIIDELDRCRPTYAIKVLEEIKHLFDVQGLVFVLGLNTKQLANAIRGAYGLKFDGDAYLRRFINRKYLLRTPTQERLLASLFNEAGFPEGKLIYPQVAGLPRGQQMSAPSLLAAYVDVYGATPRDAHYLIDRLQTSSALTGGAPLLLPYLVPLILTEIRTGKRDQLMEATKPDRVFFAYYRQDQAAQIGLHEFAQKLHAAAKEDAGNLHRRWNRDSIDFPGSQVMDARQFAQRVEAPLADPQQYSQLLETVGRFGPRDVASA
jgi:hypothetical protein